MAESARGVRKVNERIVQVGRSFVINANDAADLAWSEIPDGSLKIDPVTGKMDVKLTGETDWVPAGLQNDGMLCIAKDSKINIETFTIVNPDNGDKTHTYTNSDGVQRIKPLTADGYPVFEIEQGSYIQMRNTIEVIINNALKRTLKNGGISELTPTRFALLENYSPGTQITAQYLMRFNLGNPYPRFFVSKDQPEAADYGDFWLDTNDSIVDPNPGNQ